MALKAATRKRQSVPKLTEDDCDGMEAKLQQLRQSLALEKVARSKLAAQQYVMTVFNIIIIIIIIIISLSYE